MKQIWVLSGGPSTEFEVSISSGKVVCEHIKDTDRVIRPVVVTKAGKWQISDKTISAGSDRGWLTEFFEKARTNPNDGADISDAVSRMLAEKVECAVLVFHGQYGEDGGMQGLLQTIGVPYTGSGILASAMAYNKAVSLAAFARAGLKIARSVKVTRDNPFPESLKELTYPLFTKPVCGGSSVGVSLVKSADALKAGIELALEADSEALAEEKIEGVEISCGVVDFIENGKVVSRAMPPTLISPTEAEFFDYEAKYVPGKSKDVTPAPLPAPLVERIQTLAMDAHIALGCEGMSRTDMIVREDANAEPTLLEIQTIPGMTPTSLLPQQCAAVGISFAELIDHLITHSEYRHNKGGSIHG